MRIMMLAAICVLGACGESTTEDRPQDPYASTYEPLPASSVMIRNVIALTGTGEQLEGADILIADGRIKAIGDRLRLPKDAEEIDGTGKWVTPGIIDVHSHLGVFASPGVAAHSDGNEGTSPVTAEVWAEHSVWAQDPGFITALEGGVTSMMLLPGSANLIGGRGVTLKNVPAQDVMQMKFPGAPHGLKMACGENPKRTYGTNKKMSPATRMANVAGYRTAWIKAEEYRDKLANGENVTRDLKLETLAGVLDGEILVHIHCYRADEMSVMLQVAEEFSYKVTAFHHAVEAYKISDRLAESGTCAAMWADWWGFKMEAYDGVRENIAFVEAANACAIVHSDSEVGIQRLNQEAAKAMAAGRRAGIDIDEADAIRWITANAAGALGIAEETGSLEPGKAADVVIWNANPFSVYAKAERVFIDGALIYDRDHEARQPMTDFTLGTAAAEGAL